MQKIMFNDTYLLTQSVLKGYKTMTQIETIIAEIERLKIEKRKENLPFQALYYDGYDAACDKIIAYLNTLPAEQPNEELNKEIDRFITENVGKTITVGQVAHYFAKWQKEQLMKSATNGCYIKRNKYTKQNVLNGLSVTCEAIQKFRDGDKVKVIIVKEDEQ